MPKLSNASLDQLRRDYKPARNWIRVGMSSCGIAAGSEAVYQALVTEVKEQKLDVEVRRCGCSGFCSYEPLVEIGLEGMEPVTYGHIDADVAEWLIDAHVVRRRKVEKYAVPRLRECVAPASPSTAAVSEGGLCSKQYRIVLQNCGIIDPEGIDEYIGVDGYQAVKQALCEMTPEQVIEEIRASGLRGRGGAGYPTGLKWSITRSSAGAEKFMVCNGDEGDPGAYMDRSVLEGDPHSVIEGMIIGGYAIGAAQGYFYIRAEYPLAVERVENAIKQARRLGLLGDNILGSGFNFGLEVRLGAGAFVCGEETALIASIEGARGTPTPRPPYPSVKGLWNSPTCINNVETLANIPRIICRGAEWFSSIGTEQSKGTKVFAITGKVKNAGLVEIPLGMTLREIVMDIGGGSSSGKPVKAVQTGGPSGGVIPSAYFDTPVSYEHLRELGSIMGSGGMIVMEEGDSMVEIAKFYLGFCVEESCGKCAPCRIGGKQMLLLLEKIAGGKGEPRDIDSLRQISLAMQRASLCGLGQTASNPVLSTLRYFEDEYRKAISRNKAESKTAA